MQAQKSGSTNVLLLGVEPSAESALRKYAADATRTPVEFHSPAQETWRAIEPAAWDLIVLDRNVRSSRELARVIKKNGLQGLKIVLTEE